MEWLCIHWLIVTSKLTDPKKDKDTHTMTNDNLLRPLKNSIDFRFYNIVNLSKKWR